MQTLTRRSFQVGTLVAAALFLPGTDARSHGGDQSLIHACVKKENGDVRIVGANERCQRQERALHWSRGETPAPAPPAPTTQPAGPVPLEVVDSQGVVLGPVVSLNGSFPIVGFRRNGHTFTFGVFNEGLFSTDTVYFTGANCDGSAYVVRSMSPLPTTAVDHLGQGWGDEGQALTPAATIASGASLGGCGPVAFTAEMAPATLLFAQGAFVPPFTVR